MAWTTRRVLNALEPAWPIGFGVLIAITDKLFAVHTDAGAMLVGAGIALAIMTIIVLTTPRTAKHEPRPWPTPHYLPWGVVFIVGGVLLRQFGEPWKYDGFGIAVLGILYLLLGTFAAVRKSKSAAR